MKRESSLWHETTHIAGRERLNGDLRADVAVIGAGLAGVLIADRLQSAGVRTVVLEARQIGSGQTGNTTAKITSQHDLIYDRLIQTLGRERARQYAEANQLAVEAYAAMVEEREIACAFRRAPAYLYAENDDAALLREAEAAVSLGIDARFVRDTELPFPVAGAVCFEGQACFHPLRFLEAVSEPLTIYGDTPALAVEDGVIRTPRGTVTADSVVFATHFPFVNVPGWYFMRMHQERSYVLALESGWTPEGMYYGVEQEGLSFRSAEGLLLLGGGNHRTGENSQGGRYQALEERAKTLFPGCGVKTRWSAQDCMTLDGVPYIGQYAESQPNWYVATGFGKWGMTSAMVSAMLIAGEITGNRPAWAEVFSPERFRLSASARNLATETAQAVKGLFREAVALPTATLAQLPRGHGGIVEAEGRKVGVYKDDAGYCHVVNPRCPHLGCQLEWNPDEKTWDCPCHGSRFSYDGALLDNPAQTDLERVRAEE